MLGGQACPDLPRGDCPSRIRFQGIKGWTNDAPEPVIDCPIPGHERAQPIADDLALGGILTG